MITVREFLEDIQSQIDKVPELLDMPIVFSCHDGEDESDSSYYLSLNKVEQIQVERFSINYKLDIWFDSEEEPEGEEDTFKCNALLIN